MIATRLFVAGALIAWSLSADGETGLAEVCLDGVADQCTQERRAWKRPTPGDAVFSCTDDAITPAECTWDNPNMRFRVFSSLDPDDLVSVCALDLEPGTLDTDPYPCGGGSNPDKPRIPKSEVITSDAWTDTADLTWTAPTENEDGSPLTDLAGYSVHWGTESQDYAHSTELGAGTQSYTVQGLTEGEWFFAVRARNSDDLYSEYSNEASKSLVAPPQPPSDLVTSGEQPVYTPFITRDRIELVAIGTVPDGTECDSEGSVNGHYIVPRSAVTWYGDNRSEVLFAECSP